MNFPDKIEGKGISSFTISQNGMYTVFKKNYRRTKIAICVVSVIVLFFETIYICFSYTKPELTVCKTKSCLQSAVSLMNCMNETIDPCEDFYEFACGMFETNYPSYTNTDENSWITILSLKVKHKVKTFLIQKNEDYEPEAVHKTRMFYEVCLNFTKDQQTSKYTPLQNLWDKMGLDTNYLKSSVPLDIEKTLAKIKFHYDMDIFFSTGISEDPRNTSSYSLLYIGENEESNKHEKTNYNRKNEVITEKDLQKFTEYFNLILDQLLNQNQANIRSNADFTNVTHNLDDFEEKYLEISENAYINKNLIPELFTIKELQNLTDSVIGNNFQFNWTLYLRELFKNLESNVYEQLTSDNSNSYELLISNKVFIQNTFILLSQTPTTVIKMSILTQMLRTLNENFPPAERLDSEYCYSLTTSLFGMVTGYSMINTLDESSKTSLIEMNENIKWALRKMVNEVEWMDDETKNATLKKLANTKSYFGYPNNYKNILNILYQNLNITGNHVDNMISISMTLAKKKWESLIKVNDQENMKWDVTPDQVNAYNYNAINAFFVPAAILQHPLYHNGIQSLNYAATGSTIGHELSHNYDNTGRLFNELGNVAQWWTNKSHDEFTKRADCLVNYYNSMSAVSHGKQFLVNGFQTLDENIADIAGLKEAYFAYQRYVEMHGPEPRLPGMEQYSQEKLFFLGYANQYCQYDSSNSEFDDSNKHSPNEVRVRGTLSLLPEFAKVWSCPVGSLMNPKTEKCQIW